MACQTGNREGRVVKILFIHQNFPGQFKFLAPALVQRGHEVVGMTLQNIDQTQWQGVRLFRYSVSRGSTKGIHPWITDFETKTIRAEGCFRGALELKASGFEPDVIIAHPGWGESLFLKRVWPNAKLGIYCEFYYQEHGADVGFDPEFPAKDPADGCRVHLKNINNLLHFDIADAGISPTYWQASTFPEPFRSKITVVHDGIDTDAIVPDPNVAVTLNGSLQLTRQNKVITFVNRNLEPYRGYHVFMRALPQILREHPDAHVMIVGGNDVSYGASPGEGKSWKDIFANEVRGDIPDAQWANIHFLGNVPYKSFIALLQLSTVHVYLTYPFVLSWSLLEAMSAGCTIVASDTQPLHEAIRHDQTGRLVGFFDVDKLATETSNLLNDAEARQRLGTAARQFARETYDLKTRCLPTQLAWVESLV